MRVLGILRDLLTTATVLKVPPSVAWQEKGHHLCTRGLCDFPQAAWVQAFPVIQVRGWYWVDHDVTVVEAASGP